MRDLFLYIHIKFSDAQLLFVLQTEFFLLLTANCKEENDTVKISGCHQCNHYMSELYFLNDKTTLNYSPAVIIKKKKGSTQTRASFLFFKYKSKLQKIQKIGKQSKLCNTLRQH